MVLARTLPRGSSSTPDCSIMPGWRGPRKPIAKRTRSAFKLRVLPGISCITKRPSGPFAQSTRTQSSPATRPSSPIARLVNTDQSRSQPSSCDDEVRSFNGQSGQVSALFSRSGGFGKISSWVINAAPWRTDVPMQSDPVSPPPITTTCLPAAVIVPCGAAFAVARAALVLLRQEIHREMDAVEFASRNLEVARRLGAAGYRHRVEFLDQRRHLDADPDLDLGTKGHALGFHLIDTAVDQPFLHFEIGDAVAQQTTNAVALLEQCHRVTRTRQLLRAS